MTQTPLAKPEATTTAVVKRIDPNMPVGTVNNFERFMSNPKIVGLIEKAIANGLKPERLLSMVSVALSRSPKLLQCTPLSLFQSSVDAALCGCVTIGGTNARGYMVPYKNGKLSDAASKAAGRAIEVCEAQFQTSYLGMCDMARRSKEVATVEAFTVYDGDTFDYDQGLVAKLIHKPSNDPGQIRNRTTLRYVYALARYRGEPPITQFRVLTIAECEEHRQRSKAKDSGPWVTDYVPMCLKTAVRVLCKWLPQSPEMLEQQAHEDDMDVNSNVVRVDASGAGRTGDLARMLTGGMTDAGQQGEDLPVPEYVEEDAQPAPGATVDTETGEEIAPATAADDTPPPPPAEEAPPAENPTVTKLKKAAKANAGK
jgi:recombination protein RecT